MAGGTDFYMEQMTFSCLVSLKIVSTDYHVRDLNNWISVLALLDLLESLQLNPVLGRKTVTTAPPPSTTKVIIINHNNSKGDPKIQQK